MTYSAVAFMLNLPVVSDSLTLQVPLSMGFSRQEYWSRLPFPTPRDLPNPGIKSMLLLSPVLAGGFFIPVPSGKPLSKLSRFLGHTISVGKNYHNFATL